MNIGKTISYVTDACLFMKFLNKCILHAMVALIKSILIQLKDKLNTKICQNFQK